MRDFLQNSAKFFKDVDTLRMLKENFEKLNARKNNGILDNKEEKSINRQIDLVNKKFKSLSNNLKERLNIFNEELSKYENSDDKLKSKTMKIHIHAHIKELTEAVNDFREAQYKYKKEEEEKFKLQYTIANPGASEDELNECISDEKGGSKLKSAFALGSRSAQGILQEANSRKTNIQKIAKMIQELVEMMNYLNEAIMKQTEVTDKIYEDAVTAHENVEAANVDLEAALRYQINASRLKRILFITIAVIVGITLFFLALKFNFFGLFSNSSSSFI